MNAECLFTTAIGLAWYVNHRDDRALHGFIRIFFNRFADHFRERPALQQPDFATRGARVVVVGIRHDRDKPRRLAVKCGVGHLYGRAKPWQTLRVGREFFKP